MATFSNPRLTATPAERMRGCVFADNFKTSGTVAANYGSEAGTGQVYDKGLTLDGSNHVYYDIVAAQQGFNSVTVSFVTTAESDGILFSNVTSNDGIKIYVNGEGVRATHGDGTLDAALEVDLTYTDGVKHTATYVIDMTAGTRALYVDALTAVTGTTSINTQIGDGGVLEVGEDFIGTIYSPRFFSGDKHTSCLTAAEHALYYNDTLTDFALVPLAAYRCDSFGDDSTGNLIWDRTVNLNDATKGDGSTSSTFPTKSTLGYTFDGTTDYISGLPALGTDYTVTAVTSDNGVNTQKLPAWHSDNDTSLTALLTAAGGFEGDLHNMVLCSSQLTELEKNHAKYYQNYWQARGRADNMYQRLITEGTAVFAAFYNSTYYTYQDYSASLRNGTPTAITSNGFPDGITVGSGGSVVYDDDAALRSADGTIVVTGDFASAATGTTYLLDKGDNYELYATATTIVLSGDSDTAVFAYTIDNNKQIAVTWKDGATPRLYIDGYYDSDASSTIDTDSAATDDLYIGNDSTSSNDSEYDIETVLIANEPLTDAEIKALHESSLLMTDDSGDAPTYGVPEYASITQPDPSLLALYDMESQTINENANQVPNRAWFNRVVDGSTEKQGVTDWSFTNCTGAKDSAEYQSGSQSIKLTTSATGNFHAYQSSVTQGKVFRVLARFKSDGDTVPYIIQGGTVYFTGTTSTGWDDNVADKLIIAKTSSYVLLGGSGTSAGQAEYIDSVAVYEYENLIIDDCSVVNGAVTVDSDDWTAGNSGTLSKPSSPTTNELRVTGGGVAQGHARIGGLITGHEYRLVCQLRGDGSTGYPYIFSVGGAISEVGTTSNSWQDLDEEFTAQGAFVYFANNPTSGHSEFRNLILIDLTAGPSTHSASYTNQLTNGDCESLTGWTAWGGGALALDTSTVYKGSNSIQVSTTGGGSSGAYQSGVMTIGKRYRIRCHGHMVDVTGTLSWGVYDGAPFSANVFSTTTVDTFIGCDEEFTATSTDLYFVVQSEDDVEFYLDDCILEELDEHNTDATNTDGANATNVTIGNMIDFNGTSALVTGNTGISPFAYQTHTIGCWFAARNPQPLVTDQGVYTNGSSANATAQYMALRIQASQDDTYAFSDGTSINGTDFTAVQNNMHIVSASRTYDGSSTVVDVYIDGVLADSNTFTTTSPDVSVTAFLLGYLDLTRYFDGQIGLPFAYNEPKDATWHAAMAALTP